MLLEYARLSECSYGGNMVRTTVMVGGKTVGGGFADAGGFSEVQLRA